MAANVKAQPDSYHTVTPYLIVAGAASAIEFYKKAFGAIEKVRMDGPDGRIGHAELQIGDSVVMLADEHPERGARGPKSVGGSPISLLLYADDVDKVVAGALAVGAKVTRPVEDQFYGDRLGGVEDPFGHLWYVATHVEDVTPEEMKRRMAAMAHA
jgi:PhnB protein